MKNIINNYLLNLRVKIAISRYAIDYGNYEFWTKTYEDLVKLYDKVIEIQNIGDEEIMKHKLLELLEVVDFIPEDFKRLNGAFTHPQGYDIIHNEHGDLKLLKLNTGGNEDERE